MATKTKAKRTKAMKKVRVTVLREHEFVMDVPVSMSEDGIFSSAAAMCAAEVEARKYEDDDVLVAAHEAGVVLHTISEPMDEVLRLGKVEAV
jgi:hypothetical protein